MKKKRNVVPSNENTLNYEVTVNPVSQCEKIYTAFYTYTTFQFSKNKPVEHVPLGTRHLTGTRILPCIEGT